MTPASLFGPLISCQSIEAHVALFSGLLGMEPMGSDSALSASAVYALFGTAGRDARWQVLQTPGTRTGVVLLEFSPPPAGCMRDRSTALYADALKVIDFYVPEFDRMLAHVAACGYALEPDVAAYDLPEGRFREAHLWGPDNVILGLLGGPADFFRRFAIVTDRMFSEVQSISTPVSDLPAVQAFYDEVLGLSTVYEYRISDPSFADLIGTSGQLHLRATNIGRCTEEPYFGLIDYGLADGQVPSLRNRGRLLARGVTGAVVLVADIAAAIADAQRRGDHHSEIISLAMPCSSDTSVARVEAPHGVGHLLVQPP